MARWSKNQAFVRLPFNEMNHWPPRCFCQMCSMGEKSRTAFRGRSKKKKKKKSIARKLFGWLELHSAGQFTDVTEESPAVFPVVDWQDFHDGYLHSALVLGREGKCGIKCSNSRWMDVSSLYDPRHCGNKCYNGMQWNHWCELLLVFFSRWLVSGVRLEV